MNNYKLYEVDHIKGMMMYSSDIDAANIIETEHLFETQGNIITGSEYVITITK